MSLVVRNERIISKSLSGNLFFVCLSFSSSNIFDLLQKTIFETNDDNLYTKDKKKREELFSPIGIVRVVDDDGIRLHHHVVHVDVFSS